jgi:tRNA1Val (adenine37-N6)-methyltransferase
MKVCTDSCLFGAWIAKKIEDKILRPEYILDIGSGTGLLTLMLAQKSPAIIDAVEIDENSFEQTMINFQNSHWKDRLNIFHADIKTWGVEKKYDLIISNPPFFENDLRSANQNKNVAKHHDGLTLKELLNSVKKYLTTDGNLAVLLPFHRVEQFKNHATEFNFFPREELHVRQTSEHQFFRGMLLFERNKMNRSDGEMSIKNKEGNYTEEFNRLLNDYYL